MRVASPNRSATASPWLGLVVAALAWIVAYGVNGRWWAWVVGDVVRLDLGTRFGSAVEFFVYDTTKILLLLAGIIFAVTVLRSFMSVERTRALLGGRREGISRGVMSTPALVIDDRVVLAGRIPSVAELTNLVRGATS